MLVGYLPWNEPTKKCGRFMQWRRGNYTIDPWSTLKGKHPEAFDLLKGLLNPNLKDRFTIDRVEKSLYFNMESVLTDTTTNMLLGSVHGSILVELRYKRKETLDEDEGNGENDRKRGKFLDEGNPDASVGISHTVSTAASKTISTTDLSTRGRYSCGADESSRGMQDEELECAKRINNGRQSWFRTDLFPHDIIERFKEVAETVSSVEGTKYPNITYKEIKEKNVLVFCTPDPHKCNDDGMAEFSVRAWPYRGHSVVDFMFMKGSAMWAWQVKNHIRTMIGNIMDSIAEAPLTLAKTATIYVLRKPSKNKRS
eukprot:m.33768 g.33768  ORF g.33768 m.33768 type:complete len:312 (+) comp9879_c0_seq2:717-1652(+)